MGGGAGTIASLGILAAVLCGGKYLYENYCWEELKQLPSKAFHDLKEYARAKYDWFQACHPDHREHPNLDEDTPDLRAGSLTLHGVSENPGEGTSEVGARGHLLGPPDHKLSALNNPTDQGP